MDVETLRVSSRFDSLDQQTQVIISAIVKSTDGATWNNAMTQEIRDQLSVLMQIIHRIDRDNEDQHRLTRRIILQQQRLEQKQRLAEEQRLPQEQRLIQEQRLAQEQKLEQEQRLEQGGNGLGADAGDMESITAMTEILSVSDKNETYLRAKVNKWIIQTLQFSTMTSRYENIFEAYPKTFEWAFAESTKEQLPWSNLSKWLREGDGIYWISGKAGSGNQLS